MVATPKSPPDNPAGITAAKRAISRLTLRDVYVVRDYCRARADELFKRDQAAKRAEHIARVRALPAGTPVIITRGIHAGAEATIVSHGRKWTHIKITVPVRGMEAGQGWRYDPRFLSPDVEKERSNAASTGRTNRILMPALNNLVADTMKGGQ